jgi:hypothetical protein
MSKVSSRSCGQGDVNCHETLPDVREFSNHGNGEWKFLLPNLYFFRTSGPLYFQRAEHFYRTDEKYLRGELQFSFSRKYPSLPSRQDVDKIVKEFDVDDDGQ